MLKVAIGRSVCFATSIRPIAVRSFAAGHETIPLATAKSILQLPADGFVSPKEVKDAYRRRSMDLHPDRNKGNEEEAAEQFKDLKKSLDVAYASAEHEEVKVGKAEQQAAWKASLRKRRKGGR